MARGLPILEELHFPLNTTLWPETINPDVPAFINVVRYTMYNADSPFVDLDLRKVGRWLAVLFPNTEAEPVFVNERRPSPRQQLNNARWREADVVRRTVLGLVGRRIRI